MKENIIKTFFYVRKSGSLVISKGFGKSGILKINGYGSYQKIFLKEKANAFRKGDQGPSCLKHC